MSMLIRGLMLPLLSRLIRLTTHSNSMCMRNAETGQIVWESASWSDTHIAALAMAMSNWNQLQTGRAD